MSIHPTELYKTEQIRALEQYAMEKLDISEKVLMERAGKAALKAILEQYPDLESMTVLCGKGNNAGDGYMLAAFAAKRKLKVQVYYLEPTEKLPPTAQAAAKTCFAAGIELHPFTKGIDCESDVVVDALLGIGLKGDVTDKIASAVKWINESGTFIVSLDVPTGLNADTGAMMGEVVYANMTVTFIALKQGMTTAEGLNCCGEIVLADLGLNETGAFEAVPINAICTDLLSLQEYLVPRLANVHKGNFGRVLVIGGDRGFPGAARMAGEAALRVGAGLVTVATHPDNVSAVVAGRPELICYGISKPAELDHLLKEATVIALGPGLGRSDWSRGLFERAITQKHPMVVDASALHWLAEMPKRNDNWVLTPHPGEAGVLLQREASDVQADRFGAAVSLHKTYGGVIVLKGAGTIIQAADEIPSVVVAGNPGMATAGMGDVLTGIIAGLIAQDLSLVQASELGTEIHANAGDAAALEGQRGLIATDLFPYLRELVNPSLEYLWEEEFLEEEDEEEEEY